ncbi:MAG: hypothetical protein ABIP75_05545 [Pyrinomonadaceae bacterium]
MIANTERSPLRTRLEFETYGRTVVFCPACGASAIAGGNDPEHLPSCGQDDLFNVIADICRPVSFPADAYQPITEESREQH